MKQLAGWLKRLTERLTERLTVQQIAAVLVVVGVAVFVIGVVNKHCACASLPNLGDTLNDTISDFYANVAVDCLSIAFAILVLDRLNERRAERELKAQLIRDLGSRDNGIALKALEEIRARGWHKDGSLRGVRLSEANLQRADLRGAALQGANLSEANLQRSLLHEANLQGAHLSDSNLQHAALICADLCGVFIDQSNLRGGSLSGANLEGAMLIDSSLRANNLSGANLFGAFLYGVELHGAGIENANLQNAQGLGAHKLVTVYRLHGATMPDGSRYDGRFNLKGDLFLIEMDRQGGLLLCSNDVAISNFYGVTLEEYLAGQEWAREHLADLRREAGLDPDTGLLLEPTNGVEPQSAEGTEPQPAPRRNGQRHKASMVAHRTRR